MGMVRASTRAGLTWHEPAMWAVGLLWSINFILGLHWHEPTWAGPRTERSFPLFFDLKLSKIQKIYIKHGSSPREARAGPRTKFENFKPDLARPATHGPGPDISPSPAHAHVYSYTINPLPSRTKHYLLPNTTNIKC